MATEQVTGSGNLVAIEKPKFLTMVGKPANKMAFKVVRSDGEAPMKTPIVRRQRRAEPSPILQLQFPVGYTDEQVTAQMQSFGLTGYSVESTAAGITATRSDLKSISGESTVNIRLTADGISAVVARGESTPDNPKSQITVTSLVFRADKFDAAAVQAWLKTNGLEEANVTAAEGEGDFHVIRAETPEGEETRTVELEEGVSATIIRSDAASIPDGYVAVVNETAYGNWGWGQLDFAAAMADEEFCDVMDEALYRLRDVLRNILLYSALPLAERKTLMVNALEQFKGFSVGILDTLPRQVLVAVVRSASNQLEKVHMSNTASGGATTKPATTATTAPAVEAPVTRSEMATIAAEAAVAAIQALGLVTRADPAAATPVIETKTEPAPVAAAPVAITREDVTAAVSAAIAPLVDRMKQVEGSTVLRSDGDDAKVQITGKGVEGESKDVFRGAPAFSGLGLHRPAK